MSHNARSRDEDRQYSPFDKYKSDEDTRKPYHIQHILFYALIVIIILILTKLVVIPALNDLNTENAMNAYQAGNIWMEEWEYQKAIESYAKAISFRSDFADAWRLKGYAELAKGAELELQRPELAQASYQAAIESLRMAVQYDKEEQYLDPDTVKGLGNAYERLGMWKEARIVYESAKETLPSDPDINGRLQLIQAYLYGGSKTPPVVPIHIIRPRTTG